MENKAVSMLEEEDSCRSTLLALEKEKNEILEAQDQRCGEHKSKLKRTLEEIGVERGQYHGGAFNGNMAIRLLERYREFLQPFTELEMLHAKFFKVLSILSELSKLPYATRILDDEEIKNVCQLCDDFVEVYPALFSGYMITRKMHNLTHKIPKFVMRWRSIGIFAEQAGESIHNQEGRTPVCLRTSPKKILLLMQAQEQRIRAQLSSGWSAERICDTCRPARVFKRYINGAMVCPRCYNFRM